MYFYKAGAFGWAYQGTTEQRRGYSRLERGNFTTQYQVYQISIGCSGRVGKNDGGSNGGPTEQGRFFYRGHCREAAFVSQHLCCKTERVQ